MLTPTASAGPGAGALAHAGQPIEPHDLWGAWSTEPLVLVGLVLAVWAFQRGTVRRHPALPRWRVRCFAGAVVAMVVALVSPLDAMSGSLASAHMVQHVLLVLVAAPLLALSAPVPAMLRGSPLVVRHSIGRWRRGWRRWPGGRALTSAFRQPAVVWLLHVATLWFWHASVPYDAALGNRWVHIAEHATFLATGVLFWRVVLSPRPAERVPHGVGVVLVFAMALQSVFLSALLTFATTPWYEGYATTTGAWGLEHLADQQLAGVIMWVPAGLVYLAAGLALLVTWIRSGELEPVPA